jgi:hypothetical protein
MTVGPGYGMAASGAGGLRASDADRERAVEVLNTAFAEGRLPKDDYDALVGHVYSAHTRADLERVTAELPGGGLALYTVTKPGTNQLAVASLACGVGQLMVGPLSAIPAIVLGHIAHRQIRQTGEEGAGLATAGLVLGWIGAGLTVLAVVVLIIIAVAFVSVAHHATGAG